MSLPENNILVPTDFSEQSIIALKQSYNLAKFTNAKITLLNVNDGLEQVIIQEKLNKLAKETSSETGIEIIPMIVKGKNAYEEILKVAENLHPLFIIMGLNSSEKVRNLMGYNAFRLVRESPCPVITIKGKYHRPGCKTIILPLDLTKESREKVGKAIELAKYFGAAIRIVSVRLPKERPFENQLISYSHQVKNFIKEKGIPCSIKTLEGKDIAKMIIDYANRMEGDLIMIMSNQLVGLKELFIGTTAQQIVNQSNIPVLTMRPVERKDTSVFISPY